MFICLDLLEVINEVYYSTNTDRIMSAFLLLVAYLCDISVITPLDLYIISKSVQA